MNYFLAKTDPKTYSINDFFRDKTTTWDGVTNAQAVKVLKSMKKGDRVLIYHSQGEATIRGLASVVGNSRPDPKTPKSWLIDFKLLKVFNEPYVSLTDIKQTKKFPDFALIRQSRLSTMQCPSEFIEWLKDKGFLL